MKAIETNLVITGIRAKVDGSIGISASTPELSPEEKVEFMKLQGVNLVALLNPLDEKDAPKYKIDKNIEQKTPSERLRGVLYIYWEQLGSKEDFNDFYRNNMEKFIDLIKGKLHD